MVIQVFSKPGCGRCTAAKDKLRKMGYAYEELDLETHVRHHDGWREDASVELMAAHTLMDTMPIIRVNEEYLDYPSAMRRLKAMRSTVASAT